MRRLLFAFLIMLMPLRGWAGDVMAVQMLAQNSNAMHLVAEEAHSMWANGSNDSPMSAQMPDDCPGHHEAASPAQHGDCKTCSACQICHTVAVEPTLQAMAVLPSAHQAPPGAVSTPFASAVLAPGLKPPIS